MAFPFYWIGALTAGLFLATVFAVFGVALRLLNRTTDEIRDSMLPGLVSGFRDWAVPRTRRVASSPGAVSPASGAVIEEAGSAAATTTERLTRR